MNLRHLIAGAAVLVMLTGCVTTSTRTHPTLEEELLKVNTVVIAPPRVEIEFKKLVGENNRLEYQEDAIRAQLMTIARAELLHHGFEVIEFDFDDAMKNDVEFAESVSQVRAGFDKAREELQLGKHLSEEEAKAIRASLGEAVNIVASESGADAILLMRYSGWDKSGGHVAKDIGISLLVAVLTSGMVMASFPTEGAMTEAALIDGTTGEVLWADIKGGALDAVVADVTMDSMPHDVDPGQEPPEQ